MADIIYVVPKLRHKRDANSLSKQSIAATYTFFIHLVSYDWRRARSILAMLKHYHPDYYLDLVLDRKFDEFVISSIVAGITKEKEEIKNLLQKGKNNGNNNREA